MGCDDCKHDATIQDLLEEKGSTKTNLKNILDTVKDIKNNHIKEIYRRIDALFKKLNGRPSWTVCTIITLLSTLCGVLLREVLR